MLPLRKYKCTPLKRPENTAFLGFRAMHTPLSGTSKQTDFEAKIARILARGVHSLSHSLLHAEALFPGVDMLTKCCLIIKSLTYDTR